MVAALAAIILVSMLSCRNSHSEQVVDEEVLVQVGDSALTLSDVLRRIPHGLDPEDSLQMLKGIVDKWVSDLVLIEVAEKNISDMERIDRMVEDYRRSLIVNEYLSTMSGSSESGISDRRLKDYYEAHRDEFVLTQPLVKGALVRVDQNDPNLENLRKWMNLFSEESIDNIERSGLRHATAYEYFRDEWHEWSDIVDRIPYRFFDADAFLRSTSNLETTADGSVYLLHISDYILSGEEMPYDFAKLKIREILRSADAGAERNRLKTDIYKKKIKEGFLRPGLYDPLNGEISIPMKRCPILFIK